MPLSEQNAFDFIVFVKKSIDNPVTKCQRVRVIATNAEYMADGLESFLKIMLETRGLFLFTSIVKNELNYRLFQNFHKDFVTVRTGQNLIA